MSTSIWNTGRVILFFMVRGGAKNLSLQTVLLYYSSRPIERYMPLYVHVKPKSQYNLPGTQYICKRKPILVV